MDTSRSRGKIDGQKTLEQQLADDYARITEPQELDPRILGVLRVCLEQIPGRISATPATRRVVIQLIVRLVQVIALHNPDLSGTPREIDLQIAQLIGEHEIGARELYRALVVPPRAAPRDALIPPTTRVQRDSWDRSERRSEKILAAASPSAHRAPPRGRRTAASGSTADAHSGSCLGSNTAPLGGGDDHYQLGASQPHATARCAHSERSRSGDGAPVQAA
jgi:hypothetical protein